MNLHITYHSNPLGQAEIRSDGLFWFVNCQISGGLFRLYAVDGFVSEYLGIPGADGRLRCRVARSHLPHGISAILATQEPKGAWLPWTGEVGGVTVAEGLLRNNGDRLQLALPPEEMVKFPEWLKAMTRETITQRDYAVLSLTPDGTLPQTEKEHGGTEDETMDCNAPADCLSDAAVAGDSGGAGGSGRTVNGVETGRPDL